MKMDSEGCSLTENSSLHLERGQQNDAMHSHFTPHHEGSLQVPIPCAVMGVVFTTVFIIALIALSVGKYNCPGQFSVPAPEGVASSCSDDWVGYQRKCYYFSAETQSWPLAHNSCSRLGATLAVIDSAKDMIFLKRYSGRTDHWIGLEKEAGQSWTWSNGKEFNNWFNLTGSENCAFLNSTSIGSTECERNLHWICSKPSKE